MNHLAPRGVPDGGGSVLGGAAKAGRLDEAQAHARDDGAVAVRAWQPPADAASRTPAQPTLLDTEG